MQPRSDLIGAGLSAMMAIVAVIPVVVGAEGELWLGGIDPPHRCWSPADSMGLNLLETRMSGTPSPRPSPQVIRVPPPTGVGDPRMLALLGVVVLLLGLSVGRTLPSPGKWVAGALGLMVAGPIFFWSRYEHARYRKERAKLLANHPGLEELPPVAALVVAWHKRQPTPEQVRDVLAQQERDGGQAVQIVCLGTIAVPEIGEMLFEPYIITATDLLWRRLLAVPFGLALLTLWLLQTVHVLPGHLSNPGFASPVVVAAAAGAVWVWKSGVRPTYVRLAPGIVQFMQYGLRRRRPVIRSYPMETGSIVVVSAQKKNVTFTLLRENRKDVLRTGFMRRRPEALEHIWRALLSTASIPRMSDEELIG